MNLEDLPPLTQRQERRTIAPVKSASSIDSWDFATTIHSSQTVHKPRFSGEPEDGKLNGVFVMDEVEEYDPSFARLVEPATHDPESVLEIEIEAPFSSPTTSTSSLQGSIVDDSPSSLPTSAPSSYTDSSDLSKVQSNKSFINNEPLASIAEHSHQPPVASKLRQSISVPQKLSSSSSSEFGIRRNLWQKFKANVRGCPSSNGLSGSQPDGLHTKGRKVVMPSPGKGLLSRSPSTRT